MNPQDDVAAVPAAVPGIPWKESEAKQHLRDAILAGDVTSDSIWHEVYDSNPLYQQYPRKNFRINLKNLIKALDKLETRAENDDLAFLYERIIHPRPPVTVKGYPFWDTSPASTFLRDDIKHDVHLTMSTDEFWQWREAYQQFPREIFKKHIFQEINSRSGKTFWLKQKDKKK
jgi:hypothetical protein